MKDKKYTQTVQTSPEAAVSNSNVGPNVIRITTKI